MKNDEFNKVHITNDKQISNKEFGLTQKNESTFYNDNKINKEEINDQKIVNETIEEKNKNRFKKNEIDNDQIIKKKNKTIKDNFGSKNHNIGIAAKTTSATLSITGAATLTVLVVTQGFIYVNNNPSVKFQELLISSNELVYNLVLGDTESNDFKIQVKNKNYEKAIPLEKGENSGSFKGLSSGETYSLSIYQDSFNGVKIYEESFVTKDNSASFKGYHFDKFIEEDGSFEISLDYIDNENRYSDFSFTLIDLREERLIDEIGIEEYLAMFSYTYELEKTTDKQILNLYDAYREDYGFSIDDEYECYISYKDFEEEISTDKERFYFIDRASERVHFDSLIFDETMNFLTGEFNVQLEYVDEYEYLSDFKFTLMYKGEDYQEIIDEIGIDDFMEMYSYTFNLEKTTEAQVLSLENTHEQDKMVDPYNPLEYILTYNYRGEEVEAARKEFIFADNSGAIVEFNSITFEEMASRENNSFNLTLDYVDELNYYYSFELSLTNVTGATRTWYPDVTTDEQTLFVEYGYGDQIDIFNDTFFYKLIAYTPKGEELLDEGSGLTFTREKESRFIDFLCDYNFGINGTVLPMKIEAIDELEIYTSAYMTISDVTGSSEDFQFNNGLGFYLNEWVYTDFMEGNDLAPIILNNIGNEVNFKLTLVSMVDGKEVEEIVVDKDVTFSRDKEHEIYGIRFDDNTIREDTSNLYFTMFFIDEDNGYYDSFKLRFKNANGTFEYEFEEPSNNYNLANITLGADEISYLLIENEISIIYTITGDVNEYEVACYSNYKFNLA